MDGAPYPHHGAQFFAVLEFLLEYLRDMHVANKQEAYEVKWPDDLRFQVHRDHHAPRYDMDDSKYKRDPRSIVLSVLQTLNSLNKFSHSWTRPVLGYSLAFRSAWPTMSSSTPLIGAADSYKGGFDLLGRFTRELSFGAFACNWITLWGEHFPLALARTEGSIHLLRFRFDNANSESTFRAVMEYAPSLVELNITDSSSAIFLQILQTEPNFLRGYASLRIIRLDRLRNWGPAERGPRIALGAFATA